MQPNTALQSSLRKSSNHCKSPMHAVPGQGAAPRHTQSLDPNRRPYTTDRLLVTQQQVTMHSFQLVFRVQSHAARRCVNSNSKCKTALKFTNPTTHVAAHSERTHECVSTTPQSTFETTSRQVPVHVLDNQAASIPPQRISQSSRSQDTKCSHTPAVVGNRAPKPVVRGGPRDLYPRTYVPSPRTPERRMLPCCAFPC